VVILTKDNLIKRNWHGSYVFCPQYETIKHLLFQCNIVCFIWSVIQVASGLYKPTSIVNIFENWLHNIDYNYMIFLRVRAIALIWSLCLYWNDKVFNNKILLSWNTLSMVAASSYGRSRPLYGGVYEARGYCVRRTSFLGTESSIIYRMALHLLSRLIISHYDINSSSFIFVTRTILLLYRDRCNIV
jgi:hypothetical protein